MAGWLINADDSARLVRWYQQLRQVGWKLNNEVLPEYLPRQAYETCAKRLGLWQRGTLVLEQEDEIGVLMDHCIHDFHPRAGNAVEQYIAEADPDPGSDEYVVLKAMLESFHTLVQVTQVLPGVGVRATDLLAQGCEYLIVDMGFGSSARKGCTLATRILPYGEFVTTSGAALPVDEGTLGEIRRSILPRHGTDKDGRCPLPGGRQRASDLAAAIIRLCLSRHAMERIQYAEVPPPRRL
jgi:hypothetical protein